MVISIQICFLGKSGEYEKHRLGRVLKRCEPRTVPYFLATDGRHKDGVTTMKFFEPSGIELDSIKSVAEYPKYAFAQDSYIVEMWKQTTGYEPFFAALMLKDRERVRWNQGLKIRFPLFAVIMLVTLIPAFLLKAEIHAFLDQFHPVVATFLAVLSILPAIIASMWWLDLLRTPTEEIYHQNNVRDFTVRLGNLTRLLKQPAEYFFALYQDEAVAIGKKMLVDAASEILELEEKMDGVPLMMACANAEESRVKEDRENAERKKFLEREFRVKYDTLKLFGMATGGFKPYFRVARAERDKAASM